VGNSSADSGIDGVCSWPATASANSLTNSFHSYFIAADASFEALAHAKKISMYLTLATIPR
jgi:hypothetical protein